MNGSAGPQRRESRFFGEADMNATTGGRCLALAGLLALGACAEYRISVPDSDPIQLEGQDSPYVERTMNAYLWGNILDPQLLAADCAGEGINDLVVERAYYQDLVSVLTLGIWMPFDVRFRCKAPPTSGSAFPVPKPE